MSMKDKYNHDEQSNVNQDYQDQLKILQDYEEQFKLIQSYETQLNELHNLAEQSNLTQNNQVRSDVMLSNEDMEQCHRDIQDLNEAATAFFRIPVFFSHQNLFALGPVGQITPPFTKQQQFIIRMFKEIKRVLLFPRTLPNTEQYPDTTLENIRTMVNSSYGLAAALLQPDRPTAQGEPYSPLLQIEPAMGFQRGLPILLVLENSMVDKVNGLWTGQLFPFTPLIWRSEAPNSVEQFFESVQWKEALQNWAGQVRSGYFAETGPEFEYKFNSKD